MMADMAENTLAANSPNPATAATLINPDDIRNQMPDKYPRTPHFPFSPGITNDDRVNFNYWERIAGESLILTEKLDGENTCLNKFGVFARSHSSPTKNPWAGYLKPKWAMIKTDLGNLEIFGENLYAVHSIEYSRLTNYFYVFAVREKDKWLSWEEVVFYAKYFDFPTVPIIASNVLPEDSPKFLFEKTVEEYALQPSLLGGTREGLVARIEREFKQFEKCVLKWVRKDHVKTDELWTKNWRRAKVSLDRTFQ